MLISMNIPYSDDKFKAVFWSRVDKQSSTDCWPWVAGRFQNGYGAISRFHKTLKAHRLAFEMTHGPIPEAAVVCHTCDNPPCCNPAHLFLGSNRDNTLDCIAKGRYNAFKVPHTRGEQRYNAKLSDAAVRAIRDLYAEGRYTQARLAHMFNVSAFTVSSVVRGKKWKHLG